NLDFKEYFETFHPPIQTNRANKARDLIWTVRMKGDKASWKLIKHIQARDTCLAKHLGLNST
uniref:Uncharacterized protein n=1 Tax=Hippocampus comes TaxID=109280 RepID=A0A3Q2YTF9_HIPCM